ncbi:MAG: nuclear transport factor 2 family protein [Actinomycetota bacterium]|nr:nuclear transport factor 2 family protein [Actinomycetota bacterium]
MSDTGGERPSPTLLEEHVERFNRGVRSGDFAEMVSFFAADAELVFQGIPVGPFVGRDAIADAYREQPPDDEIVLLRDDGTYAWASEPEVPAGQMFLTARDGEIGRLVIRYDR